MKELLVLAAFLMLASALASEGAQEGGGGEDALARIGRADPVLAAMLELIAVPSPSGQEEKIGELILAKLRALGLDARKDATGNVTARLPASPGMEGAPALFLTAHMDMVPGDKKEPLRPVRPRVVIIEGKEWIATDGTTTLGADDKAGVAVILDAAARLLGKHPGAPAVPHGPIEIAITVEEETSMRGALSLRTEEFQARYALVIDGENLYEVVWELAGGAEVVVRPHGARGGHSGLDIHRPDNVNAIKVLTEIDQQVPQGVVKKNERGVVLSINAGLIEGGTARNAIAPEAKITYLLRSTDPEEERKLIERIRAIAAAAQRKYQALQKDFRVEVKATSFLPPWKASTDSPLIQWVQKAGGKLGARGIRPISMHAGAESNVFASKKNAKGETLLPLLIGAANLHGIHTTAERLDWRSLVQGRDWVLEIIKTVAEEGR
ncbi:MAG: M20/M25/M40 family metallo-hydrolase [Candidatus Tectomicrobia bacterium]|nr:M20/M25/M40 family metallo-hydrolase [Candidatus Tectomicrobia bacterium]